jgi:GH24 family phage-related lysozyme (muramidase)
MIEQAYLSAKRALFDKVYGSLNEKQREAMRAFADSCGEGNYSKRSGFFKRIFDKK